MPNKILEVIMTREQVKNILDKAMLDDESCNFVVEISPSDMKAFVGRIRHLVAKGIISSFRQGGDTLVEITGYTPEE